MFLVWQAADANCIFIWYLVWNIHILNLAGDRLKLEWLYINFVSLNIAYVVKEWQGLRPELIINDSKVQYMYIYMHLYLYSLSPFSFHSFTYFLSDGFDQKECRSWSYYDRSFIRYLHLEDRRYLTGADWLSSFSVTSPTQIR